MCWFLRFPFRTQSPPLSFSFVHLLSRYTFFVAPVCSFPDCILIHWLSSVASQYHSDNSQTKFSMPQSQANQWKKHQINKLYFINDGQVIFIVCLRSLNGITYVAQFKWHLQSKLSDCMSTYVVRVTLTVWELFAILGCRAVLERKEAGDSSAWNMFFRLWWQSHDECIFVRCLRPMSVGKWTFLSPPFSLCFSYVCCCLFSGRIYSRHMTIVCRECSKVS